MSNWGRVKSLERIDRLGHLRKEKILSSRPHDGGYAIVALYKNGKRKDYHVHRLVAEAFLDNPDNLPCINHKDENPSNNHYSNLEFCSYQYNNTYGTRIERVAEKRRNGKFSKVVFQYSLNGEFIKEYPSTREVERQLKYKQGYISACCLGKYKTAYGFIWRYSRQ